VKRRTFLQAAGAAGLASGVAGCLGGGGGGDTGGADTPDGTPVGEHPAAVGLDAQPRCGDLDGNLVLAFEDPSCSRCRAFHQRVVPDIQENLVDSGEAAYVVRSYPVVYPWGEPAVQALEATFARDPDAFWALQSFYYGEQRSLGDENVLDRTETFLSEETNVDGAAVRADAENRAYDDAVQADLDAGANADVGRTTPTILLFRDGRYVTRASGSVSFDVVATALGVG
jgi:protein-disulfide isomerase